MKKIIAFAVLIVLVGIGLAFYTLRGPDVHGAPFRVETLTRLGDLLANPGQYQSADVRTEGRIVRQCPSSGCWFFLDDGAGHQIRVELGHLGRTFPQHVGGQAEIEGRVVQDGTKLELVGNGVRFK
jgi:hypothetical protein